MMPKSRIKPWNSKSPPCPERIPSFLHALPRFRQVPGRHILELAGYGIAVAAIDGIFRGEREEKDKDIIAPNPVDTAKYMKMQIMDILRGFDVLAQWKGLDPAGWVSRASAWAPAQARQRTVLDKRIKSILLADGAANFGIIFEESDYPHIKPVKLTWTLTTSLLRNHRRFPIRRSFRIRSEVRRPAGIHDNGTRDTTMSVPAIKKLHELVASNNKLVKWYDSDHILPPDKLVYDSLKWFKKTL